MDLLKHVSWEQSLSQLLTCTDSVGYIPITCDADMPVIARAIVDVTCKV